MDRRDIKVIPIECARAPGQHEELGLSFSELLSGLHRYSPSTFAQSLNVAGLCRAFGEHLGMSDAQCAELEIGGLLHDTGKEQVSLQILDKPGRLNGAESVIVRGHTILGLKQSSGLVLSDEVRGMIAFHHERWDGAGYPKGLKGEEIPLLARMLTIIDWFEAATTRSFDGRAPLKEEEALQQIQFKAGTLFDPALVDSFMHFMSTRRTAA